jgi:crotonobetainyl-CoA:carnitine CoA-transferase CaiB-like acyl-CoA transferase
MNPGRRSYRCSEGEVTVAVESEEQWHALAVCLGRPELAYPGAWEAVKAAPHDGALAHVLEAQFAEDDAETWHLRFRSHGVPVAG